MRHALRDLSWEDRRTTFWLWWHGGRNVGGDLRAGGRHRA